MTTANEAMNHDRSTTAANGQSTKPYRESVNVAAGENEGRSHPKLESVCITDVTKTTERQP